MLGKTGETIGRIGGAIVGGVVGFIKSFFWLVVYKCK
jgi:hypothetical protein